MKKRRWQTLLLDISSKQEPSIYTEYSLAAVVYLASPPFALLASFNLRLKFFRKMIAARVPYYGQQVLPHSNLLDPHLRSQFACFFVYARRKAQFSNPFPLSR